MYRTRTDGGPSLTEISFSGSPFGALYGQNVCTCASVKRAVREFLTHCKIHMGLSIRDRPNDPMLNYVKITRVDLAANLRFESDDAAEQFLGDLRLQLGSTKIPISTIGSSIMICPRRGRDYEILLYNKGCELKHNRRQRTSPNKNLIEEFTGTVRIELRLRTAELEKLGLIQPTAWTPKIARLIFRKYFQRLPIYDAITIPDKHALSTFPRKLRALIAALSAGIPIEYLCSPSTSRRHKGKLRDLGLGLNPCPTLAKSTTIATDLMNSATIVKTPQWMIEHGLVPKPQTLTSPRKNVAARSRDFWQI
ncbi:phage/plasmid replication domain-containing protein [Pandoraea apista]|nr:phage/plasmid replication protein [Pandoraea apista]